MPKLDRFRGTHDRLQRLHKACSTRKSPTWSLHLFRGLYTAANGYLLERRNNWPNVPYVLFTARMVYILKWWNFTLCRLFADADGLFFLALVIVASHVKRLSLHFLRTYCHFATIARAGSPCCILFQNNVTLASRAWAFFIGTRSAVDRSAKGTICGQEKVSPFGLNWLV